MGLIPSMIFVVEKKLAKSGQSEEAETCLEQARQEYEKARVKQSGSPMEDWVSLYVLLDSAVSHIVQAITAYIWENRPYNYNADLVILRLARN